ncbi:hypothetical protein C731_2360 [Mycolicibacterium hassiacum DSM 44199]|uniref:Uncharacterized protein n=1 Tax=Mycolicibacterium hassiacum (strain DSM 44199 / CIP 105218 / JCM 12690 / 3849) TaxID=1122247 RepID=K5B8G5_MYCHD|nr:hypothetical protein C731_2360 [Mycolicibacterium hassiacum DSM 44199]
MGLVGHFGSPDTRKEPLRFLSLCRRPGSGRLRDSAPAALAPGGLSPWAGEPVLAAFQRHRDRARSWGLRG